MAWIKDVCEDDVCGGTLGVVKGIFGVSLFTASETEEIASLKNLALSVIEKSPQMVTEPIVCDAIKTGQKYALETFAKNAPLEAFAAGVVTAAKLVCGKAFKQRFGEVLMGACLNLTGC
jgi:hydroxymethylpyrimidine/phosphomethylpyrimidine kinase